MLPLLANLAIRALKLVACVLLTVVLILVLVVSVGCLASGEGAAGMEGLASIGELVVTLFQDVIVSERDSKRVG